MPDVDCLLAAGLHDDVGGGVAVGAGAFETDESDWFAVCSCGAADGGDLLAEVSVAVSAVSAVHGVAPELRFSIRGVTMTMYDAVFPNFLREKKHRDFPKSAS
jgi:hypothetical protein